MHINPDIIVNNKNLGQIETEAFKTDTYSTNETKTNKVWIDGKPIYRKVIRFSYTNNKINQASLGVTNYSSIWIDLSSSFLVTNDNRVDPAVSCDYRDSNGYSIRSVIETNTNKIDLLVGGIIANGTAYITVEYTKK